MFELLFAVVTGQDRLFAGISVPVAVSPAVAVPAVAVSVGDSGCCARPQLCLRRARSLQRCRRRELAESRRRSVNGCGCRRLCSPVPALLLSLGLSPGSAHAVAPQGQRHQPLPVLLPWLHEPPRLWRTLPCSLGTAANLGVLPGPRETPGCLPHIPADV